MDSDRESVCWFHGNLRSFVTAFFFFCYFPTFFFYLPMKDVIKFSLSRDGKVQLLDAIINFHHEYAVIRFVSVAVAEAVR